MQKETKIVILGGDSRFVALGENLKSKYSVSTEVSSVSDCNFLILPLPSTSGNSTILNSPKSLDLKDIFPLLNKHTCILGGKVSENLKSLADEHEINIHDYYTDEFETLNAIPSSEGAIEIAMRETDFTLCGSEIFVLGYGRIGKILSKMLSGIGAKVTVFARRKEPLALAKGLGLKTSPLSAISDKINHADVIFNTIPSLILNHKNLLNVRKDALIIDLASKPGGVDFDSAKSLGLKTIHALGLPAKTSPKTSSEILFECICSLIEERRTNGT